MVIPIVQGRLRGKRWIVGAGVHGYWLGSFEWEKRRAFEQAVPPGGVVFDIGANVGFYTLIASQLVGPAGRVFAFEPLPRNLRYLKAHLALNRISNVAVLENAVWDRSEVVRFDTNCAPSMARVSESGRLEVPAVALDDFVRGLASSLPDVIKMDIEGGELQALKGATAVLCQGNPTVFLATHGPAVHRECCALLSTLGYHVEPLSAGADLEATDEVVATKRLPRG